MRRTVMREEPETKEGSRMRSKEANSDKPEMRKKDKRQARRVRTEARSVCSPGRGRILQGPSHKASRDSPSHGGLGISLSTFPKPAGPSHEWEEKRNNEKEDIKNGPAAWRQVGSPACQMRAKDSQHSYGLRV